MPSGNADRKAEMCQDYRLRFHEDLLYILSTHYFSSFLGFILLIFYFFFMLRFRTKTENRIVDVCGYDKKVFWWILYMIKAMR